MHDTLLCLKKILLIRFSSIGDIVLTTPVIRALKKQLNCELHVLTKSTYQSVLIHNPYIDKIHTVTNKISEAIEDLRLEQFDFVVDLQKNVRSLKLRKALQKPGASFPKLNKQKWLIVNFKKDFLPDVHIVDRYFEAVKKLGVTNDGGGLDYFIADDEYLEAVTISPVLKKSFIGFVIGGRHNTKMLPAEKVTSIISKIEFPVVLLGGPDDVEKGELILKMCYKEDVFNTCGKYTLNQSASLVQQASLIITNDTGLMHIAAAFRKPTISIWGNTIPKFGMNPYMPANEKLSVYAEVQGLKCRPCSKLGYSKCPKKHFKCMLDQDEEFILRKVSDLITETTRKSVG